jgi:hypothetical protein
LKIPNGVLNFRRIDRSADQSGNSHKAQAAEKDDEEAHEAGKVNRTDLKNKLSFCK